MNILVNTIVMLGFTQNMGRKLSETVTNNCIRWGAIASIVCPELIQGNIRSACSLCPSIVQSVQTACYDFPGSLCAGDCENIPSQIETCDSNHCQTCWESQTTSCQNCHSSCFTHSHCYDETTQTFSTPPTTSRNSIINNCIELKQVYTDNDCCISNGGNFHNMSLYIKIDI